MFGDECDKMKQRANKEFEEAKASINGLDPKERKWFKILIYIIIALIMFIGLSMCVGSCSKPKVQNINGVQYPVDKNGVPYQQAQNGEYIPAPGYVNQSQPIQPSGPGFWTGALTGAGLGYLASKVATPAPPVPQYQPTTVVNKYYPIPTQSASSIPSIQNTVKPVVQDIKPKVRNPGDQVAIQERAKMEQERAQKAKQEQLKADLRAKQQARSQVKSASSGGFKSFSQNASRRK